MKVVLRNKTEPNNPDPSNNNHQGEKISGGRTQRNHLRIEDVRKTKAISMKPWEEEGGTTEKVKQPNIIHERVIYNMG